MGPSLCEFFAFALNSEQEESNEQGGEEESRAREPVRAENVQTENEEIYQKVERTRATIQPKDRRLIGSNRGRG